MTKEQRMPQEKPRDEKPKPKFLRYVVGDFGAYLQAFVLLIASLLIAVVKGTVEPKRVLRGLKRLLRQEDPDLRAARAAALCALLSVEPLAGVFKVTGSKRDLREMLNCAYLDWVPALEALVSWNRASVIRRIKSSVPLELNAAAYIYAAQPTSDNLRLAQEAAVLGDNYAYFKAMIELCRFARPVAPYLEQIYKLVSDPLREQSDPETGKLWLLYIKACIAARVYEQALNNLSMLDRYPELNHEALELYLQIAEHSDIMAYALYAREAVARYIGASDHHTRREREDRLRVCEVRCLLASDKEDKVIQAYKAYEEATWLCYKVKCLGLIARHVGHHTHVDDLAKLVETMATSHDLEDSAGLDQARLELLRTKIHLANSKADEIKSQLEDWRELAGLIKDGKTASAAYLAIYQARQAAGLVTVGVKKQAKKK